MKQYKLGTNPVGGMPIVEQIEIMKSVGFDGFHTSWMSIEEQEAISNKAAKIGLIQQSIHAPWGGAYNISHLWTGDYKCEFARNFLIQCVKDCARFDIPVMVIHPFVGLHSHTPTEQGLDNYARIVEAANECGVKLAFENVEGEEYLAALMERFWNEPSLGFCWDTGHELCFNHGRDMMALYGKKLCHTHLNDNLGARDDEIVGADLHLLPTDGITDWHGAMERIKQSSYDGIIMGEFSNNNKTGKNGTRHLHAELSIEEFMMLAYEKLSKVVSM